MILRLFCNWIIRVLVKVNLVCPRHQTSGSACPLPPDLSLSSPPEGPPALLSTGSSCTRGTCGAAPARRVATPAALEAGRVCPALHLQRGLGQAPLLGLMWGEPAQVSVEQPQQSAFIAFYTTWLCATFLLLWNMWIVRKAVELKINKMNIPIQVWGEARDAALLTHSRWCNVAGPQISLWVARLSRGTCIFKNRSTVDLQ